MFCDRLTFWLSNSIVLRAIVSHAVVEMPLPSSVNGGSRNGCNNTLESSDDWEDPQTFILVLEKIEAWIFSRIIESVWWQVKSYFFLIFVFCSCIRFWPYFSWIIWFPLFCPFRPLLHICSPQLQRLVMEVGLQTQGKHMEGDIHWVIKSRGIFLLNYGRGHSKMPVKGFVLLEL